MDPECVTHDCRHLATHNTHCWDHKGEDEVLTLTREILNAQECFDAYGPYKQCLYVGCTKSTTFNFPPQDGVNVCGRRNIFCKLHKLPGMINTKSSKCVSCGEKQQVYNYPGLSVKYCNNCRSPGMIDVRNNKCIVCGKKQRNFAFPNQPLSHCGDCRLPGMIYPNAPRCKDCGLVIALYNFPSEKIGKFCSACKTDDMVNVVNRICIHPDCRTQVIYPVKYDKLCVTHYCEANPDAKLGAYMHVKESLVIEFIKRELQLDENAKIYYKKMLPNTRFTPDILIDMGCYYIIVEIDEYQHSGYDVEFQKKRNSVISEVLQKPITVIKFNPDGYHNAWGKRIKSCFVGDEKRMKPEIRDSERWNRRLSILKQRVIHWSKCFPDPGLSHELLFYSGSQTDF